MSNQIVREARAKVIAEFKKQMTVEGAVAVYESTACFSSEEEAQRVAAKSVVLEAFTMPIDLEEFATKFTVSVKL